MFIVTSLNSGAVKYLFLKASSECIILHPHPTPMAKLFTVLLKRIHSWIMSQIPTRYGVEWSAPVANFLCLQS